MIHPALHQDGEAVTIAVWVVPNASQSGIVGLHGDEVRIRVSAPPEGGKANAQTAGLLEDALGRPVEMIRGMSGRHKVFKVTGLDPELICRKLGI